LAWVLHLETLTFDKGIDELTHISGVMLDVGSQLNHSATHLPNICFWFDFDL
jgi:hypothetical protein